jgi:TRAP-type mannitol/chloroaromatic compound transport system substrate-binding protein
MTDEGTTQTNTPTSDDVSPTADAPVSRRGFLGKASSATVGAGLVVACGAGGDDDGAPAVQTRPRVMWRMASSFPRSLDTIFGTAERMGEMLSELTEGRFQIRPYPAGELVPGLQVMDAAQQGSVQVAQSTSYYFTGKNPALAFDAGVPFGMTARQHNAWLAEGGGGELMAEIFSDFGIVPFQGGNTGGQMGGWFRREVPSLADLNGIKMRIPGLGGEVMDRLGLTVQVLAGGEIYPALERGAIDATEWVGPYDDEKLGFHQAAQFYYYPGWWEPCASMTYQVNRRAWDQLPSDYQAAFRVASAYSTQVMLTTYDAKNPPALQRLLDQGVQMRRFSDDIMQAAKNAIDDIQAEKAADDALYRRVYEHYSAFREASFRWFGTNEFAYSDFAFGNRGGTG